MVDDRVVFVGITDPVVHKNCSYCLDYHRKHVCYSAAATEKSSIHFVNLERRFRFLNTPSGSREIQVFDTCTLDNAWHHLLTH